MEIPVESKSLTLTIKEFFGMDNRTALREIARLTPQDKLDLVAHFMAIGISTTEVPNQAAA